jgi:hypothetical protein
MPLKVGYSRETVQANIATVFLETGDNAQSVAVAYAMARRSYFKRFPDGALPAWLAFPKGYRMRKYYDAHGKPRMAGANPLPLALLASHAAPSAAFSAMRKNPSAPPANEVRKAAKLFADFAGYDADTLEAIPLQPLPKTGLAFGQLVEIGYISFRDGEPYRHTFRLKRSRPLLVASHDGKQVLLIGGSYAFTERGIEDR